MTSAVDKEVNALMQMAHSPLHNYAIPGLTSWLLGMPGPQGTVRLFTCSREHQEAITPHSHRFDFHARVVRGWVRNRVWIDTRTPNGGDEFQPSVQIYDGEPGKYRIEKRPVRRYFYEDMIYEAGDVYSMHAAQIHSIYFSRDAVVQFFEGPTKTDRSTILEPWVAGGVVPTFKVEPWMFKKTTPIQEQMAA